MKRGDRIRVVKVLSGLNGNIGDFATVKSGRGPNKTIFGDMIEIVWDHNNAMQVVWDSQFVVDNHTPMSDDPRSYLEAVTS